MFWSNMGSKVNSEHITNTGEKGLDATHTPTRLVGLANQKTEAIISS